MYYCGLMFDKKNLLDASLRKTQHNAFSGVERGGFKKLESGNGAVHPITTAIWLRFGKLHIVAKRYGKKSVEHYFFVYNLIVRSALKESCCDNFLEIERGSFF